jgi:MFS family permease
MHQRRTVALLFTTRIVRLFCYGFLSVVMALYLAQAGLTEGQIGLLFTLTLVGDTGITLFLTTTADRLGRRRTLVIGAVLMLGAGLVFIVTRNPLLLMVAAIIGVISPSGNEIGPFLAVEQAGLTQLVPNERRTQLFAWYNLVGSFATASGALFGGWLAQALQAGGATPFQAYRSIIAGYAGGGAILAALFLLLSPAVEVHATAAGAAGGAGGTAAGGQVRRTLGLHKSRSIVFRLSALFAMDAFGGGFVVQSLVAYWFHVRFGVEAGVIGSIFFGANVLAGVSALLAGRLARKIGLIRTMVFTHIPSNIMLMLVPLMPSLAAAIAVLLARFSISQMDVPTRQSYTMAVVAPDERSAASGVTAIARSVGAAASPSLTGLLISVPALLGAPFLLSGGIKIVYDLLLYRSFRKVAPPEEKG